MRITRIELTPFVIPLHKPTVWATGSMTAVDYVLVQIHGEDGLYGVSEAIPRPMIYGETQHSIYYAIRDYLAPLILGEDSLALERIWKKMGSLAANPGAKAAIDIALHDLNGKLLGLPVHRLLGGPARSQVAVTWMIPLMSHADMLAELEQKLAEGFCSFKIKGGLDAVGDIQLVRDMRRIAGPSVQLYLDANQMYDRETALRVLTALDGTMDCIEEPMAVHDDLGRRDLAMRSRVPLLGDDSCFTVAEVARQLALGALSRISIKMPRTGFWLARRVVDLCESANVKLQINTQSETMLGTAGCLQLAAAYAQISLPNELTFFLEVQDNLITNSLPIRDGFMTVPQGPGMGVEIDWDKVRHYSVALS